MNSKVDRDSEQPGNFLGTAAAFEAIERRCLGDSQGAANALTAVDHESLALAAFQLAGLAAQSAIAAHNGDSQAAAAQVARWSETARLEHRLSQ